jgi:hypothetical protein
VNDAHLTIGNIGKTVYIGRFQGVREGHFRDCTDVEIKKNGKRVAAVRLTDAEVTELIALLSTAVRGNFLSA